jgi:hypothetical protein
MFQRDGTDTLPGHLEKSCGITIARATQLDVGVFRVDWTAAGRGPRLPSMTLLLRSGWAAVPFMKGYVRKITLTGEERDRLAGLLFSRQLIDLVFRLCRDPESAVSRAKRLPVMHRDGQAKARDILAVCPLA